MAESSEGARPDLRAEDVRAVAEEQRGFWLRSAVIQAAVIASSPIYILICSIFEFGVPEWEAFAPDDEIFAGPLVYALIAVAALTAVICVPIRAALGRRAMRTKVLSLGPLAERLSAARPTVDPECPLGVQMMAYLRSSLIGLAVAHSPAIHGLILYLLLGNYLLALGFCGFSVVLMLYMMGTPGRFIAAMERHLAYGHGR